MWGVEARHQNQEASEACWDVVRDMPEWGQSPYNFFEDTFAGVHCDTDWYEGSGFASGNFGGDEAPALLGFDDDIHDYCQWNCDRANVNILNLFSSELKYNSCRNLEVTPGEQC